MKTKHLLLTALAALALTGCATQKGYDYTALRAAKPKSILILPPVNNTTDVSGSNSLLSTMTLPLGEAGYYVLPVTLVDETFHQNGLHNPAEIAVVPPAKLRQIFGADSALYVQIKEFGSQYVVINSVTVVTADAKLVDLRTGALLWQGTATANSGEINNGRVGAGGIVGALVAAVVNQVIEQVTDVSHKVAGLTSARLLSAGQPGGLLYGPRSPRYEGR